MLSNTKGIFALLVLPLLPVIAMAQSMPVPQVVVQELTQKALAPRIQLKANVISLHDAVLSAEVAGRLEFIQDVGTTVSEGEIIASLDDEKLSWEVERAQSALNGLLADLEFKENEVERFRRLVEKDNASKTQLQREISTQQMITQQIIAAKANLAEARRNLNDARLSAPFDGMLATRFADKGEFISITDPLVRLVDLAQKEVVVAVPVQYQPLITMGMSIEVDYRGAMHTFPVSHIVPISDPSTRMIEIRLDASESNLIIGDVVTAYLPTANSSTEVSVPRDALVIRGNRTYIYLVDESQTAQQVQVTIKFAQGDDVVVEETLREGAKVIIRGAERLQPNAKVEVLPNN